MIGAVLVTYFRKKLTEVAIRTLHETTKRSDIYLIVIDNNSPDDTPAMLTMMKEKGEIDHLILNNKNEHLGPAVNQGLDFLENIPGIDFFMSFNQDFFFMDGWLENSKKVIRDLALDYLMLVYLEGVSNGKVAPAVHEKSISGGNFGKLTPRKPKKIPYDTGGGLLLKMDLLRGHHIRFVEKGFNAEHVGPGMDLFKLLQADLKLSGARLHKPCLLLQDPEFNSPEYVEYYQYIHGTRGMGKTYRMYRQFGPVLDPEEYYKGSGYKISEFYSLGKDVPCDWGWDKNLEKWK